MKRWSAPPPAVFARAGLAAGGGGPPPPTTYCPQPVVLQQAGTLTLFLPGRQDVAAEVTTARITGVAGSCTLIKAKNLLRVTFNAGFSASNGPANRQPSLTLPYFVSISEGETVISKTPYSVTFDFDGNETMTSATSKPVTIELPNVAESADVEVLLGFQMTPDQLAYTAAHPDGT